MSYVLYYSMYRDIEASPSKFVSFLLRFLSRKSSAPAVRTTMAVGGKARFPLEP